MAGRMPFAVTAAGNKVGRAFIKPFYAQVYSPLRHDRCSAPLLSAAKWWVVYLKARFASEHASALAREHCICWTDAAGASRLLAAVITTPRGVWFTRCRVPDFVWRQLLPRSDDQIGVQEALAVLLLQATFADMLSGALVSVFVDNDGVSYGFINGDAEAPETNAMIAVFWLRAAQMRSSVVFHRVESASNIADGPTRPDKDGCRVLHAVGAVEVPARLHGFLIKLWFPLADDVLAQDDILVGLD